MFGLAACVPGGEGRLVPTPADGVTIVDRDGRAAAEVRENDIIVGIGGTWAAQGFQALDIDFRNRGTVARRIDLTRLGIALRARRR